MKKVYSLKDLGDAVGLKSTGYSIHVKPGVSVGLYNDIFNVRYADDDRVEQYSPGKIIPAIKSLLDQSPQTTFTDSELFDFAQSVNPKVDEDEFFEMDLGDDPIKTVNEWLIIHKIPVTVISVDEDNEDIIYEAKVK